jgi:hypothetical protein
MSDLVSDMPPAAAGFPARGRWVIDRLMVDLAPLTENQGGGIVGNLGFESVGFTKLQEIHPAVHGSRGGYGWAQWTGPRRLAYEAWCRMHTLHPASDKANYGYLLVELRGAYKNVLARMRTQVTLEECVFEFGRLYEAPLGTSDHYLPGFSGRVSYAEQAIAGLTVAPRTPQKPPETHAPTEAPKPPAPSSPHPAPALDPDSDAEAERLNAEELARIKGGG